MLVHCSAERSVSLVSIPSLFPMHSVDRLQYPHAREKVWCIAYAGCLLRGMQLFTKTRDVDHVMQDQRGAKERTR